MVVRSSALLIVAPLALAGLFGCVRSERAIVHAPVVPPPAVAVRHSTRLWIEFDDRTPDKQCARVKSLRPVCFERVRAASASALEHTLWSSFPRVVARRPGDALAPGDYVLLVDFHLAPLAPEHRASGWSAGVRGRWQLVRDGLPVVGEAIASRSRGAFAYGAELGKGAGEALDAVAVHIADKLGTLRETRPLRPVLLPRVATSDYYGRRARPAPVRMSAPPAPLPTRARVACAGHTPDD